MRNSKHRGLLYCINFNHQEVASVEITGEFKDNKCLHFKLEALGIKDFEFIKELKVSTPHMFTLNAQEITIRGEGPFVLSYLISSPFSEYVGIDKDFNVNYPFGNSEEKFIAEGILPIPRDNDDEISMTFKSPWKIISNFSGLDCEKVAIEKIEQFFCYTSKKVSLKSQQLILGEQKIILQSYVQQGMDTSTGDLNTFITKVFQFYNDELGEFKKLEYLSVLNLQPPDDFAIKTNGRTFASGENLTNGIFFGAPKDPGYLKKIFNLESYAIFLKQGIVHEVGHFYASAGPAKEKAILYASKGCTREDRFFIGETLNGYFTDLVLWSLDKENLSATYLEDNIDWRLGSPNESYKLIWAAIDIYLRKKCSSSLWGFYKMLIEKKRAEDTPFESVDWIIETLTEFSGETTPEELIRAMKEKKTESIKSYFVELKKINTLG